MKPSSLYGHLAEVYGRIRETRQPADAVVRTFFRDRHYLGARDRRWLSERVFGMIRQERLLDALAALSPDLGSLRRGERGEFPPILLAAAYALHSLGEAVESVREAVRERWTAECPEVSVDAGLDSLRRHGTLPEPPDRAHGLAVRHSFPDAVMREWIDGLGEDEAAALAEALNSEAPVCVRVNTLRCTVDECADALRGAGLDVRRGSLSPFALILPRRLPLETVRAYRDGWCEVQDEGSQVLALLMQPEQGMTLVDMCAGGGGKTLHLAALTENRAALVAADVDQAKLHELQKRAQRAGAKVRQMISLPRGRDALEGLRRRADAVLVDAPCSALGTVRRNPALKSAWSPERSADFATRQQAILEDAARLVRPGGRLVYSTCTLVRRENEEIAEWFLDGHTDFSLLSAPEVLLSWGIVSDPASPYLVLWPHRTGTDGFFAAVFRRS